jgi:hypothetical protein
MQICDAMKFLRIAVVPVILIIIMIIIGGPAVVSAQAPAKPSTAAAAPPVQLQPYTSQDQSVSAGVPSGWTVKSAVGGSINMAGPQGETINFGDVFVAHEGTFQLGQRGPGVALMNMPSSAKLTDKLVMFLQQEESLSGKPVAQIKFIYATPIQVPAATGQCGMFAVAFSAPAAPAEGMGVFCSLPPDSAQLFKLVLLLGTAPTAIAHQTAPTVGAVYNSYKIAPGSVQKMLAPYTQTASAPSGPGANTAAETQMYLNAMANQQRAIDHGFTCADANIIGDGSNWETPRECGGWAPDF